MLELTVLALAVAAVAHDTERHIHAAENEAVGRQAVACTADRHICKISEARMSNEQSFADPGGGGGG